jgi:hypothetical protein
LLLRLGRVEWGKDSISYFTVQTPRRGNPMQYWAFAQYALLLSILALVAVGSGCTSKPRLSPKVQRFLDKLEEIHEEMREEEADAIMKDYTSSSWREV